MLTQVVEPLVSKQWFVTMEPLAQKGLQAVENGDLKIIPERFEKVGKKFSYERVVLRPKRQKNYVQDGDTERI